MESLACKGCMSDCLWNFLEKPEKELELFQFFYSQIYVGQMETTKHLIKTRKKQQICNNGD